MSQFIRIKEDFVCGQCGKAVQGNGYTNHCPHCLWSKHVDVNPGDRAEGCGGLMEPVGVETNASAHILTHRCTLCGFSRRQTAHQNDHFEKLVELSARSI